MGILIFQNQASQSDPGSEKTSKFNLFLFIFPQEKKHILTAREDYRLTVDDLPRNFTDTHINKRNSILCIKLLTRNVNFALTRLNCGFGPHIECYKQITPLPKGEKGRKLLQQKWMKNTLSSYKLIYLCSIFNSICVAIFLQLSLCTLCTTVPMNQHKYRFHLQQFDFWKEHKISYHEVGWYLRFFFFLKKSFKGETSRKYTSLKFSGSVAQICVLFLHLLINICTEAKKTN